MKIPATLFHAMLEARVTLLVVTLAAIGCPPARPAADGPPGRAYPEADLGPGGPVFVMDDAGAECSLHWDARSKMFIHVASCGFGASTIGVRTAPALTGPWSAPVQVYRPPETDGPRPLVYAAKAHPELAGPDAADLVVTYATNTWEFGEQFTPEGSRSLYWPRFVLVRAGQ
ncbi:MAG: hypothetical protein PHE83_06175 [Opitutaceae bacterium]|nr:hypothetical protein [Opitutaceae bacterium]